MYFKIYFIPVVAKLLLQSLVSHDPYRFFINQMCLLFFFFFLEPLIFLGDSLMNHFFFKEQHLFKIQIFL